MKPLFSEEEFEKAKGKDELLCECYNCQKPFLREKSEIVRVINGTRDSGKFCSKSCLSSFKAKYNKKTCDKCSQNVSVINFNKHYNSCNGSPKKYNESTKYKIINKYICPYCNLEFNKYSICKHVWIHENPDKHEDWKIQMIQDYKNGKRKILNQHAIAKLNGKKYIVSEETKHKLKIAGTKRRHTEEQKQKISEQKVRLYQEHPEKIPFKMYKYFEKSYPEKTFEHGLSSNTITNYVYDYKQGMYYYDFAIPDLKIDFEIDGDFHNKKERIIRDNLRDEYSLKNGWTVIRFEARLVTKQLNYCIEKVKDIILNFDNYKGQKIKIWYKDYLNEKAPSNK